MSGIKGVRYICRVVLTTMRCGATAEGLTRRAAGVLSSLPGLLLSLPRFPSDEALGYCLSPFGLGLPQGVVSCQFPVHFLLVNCSLSQSGRLVVMPSTPSLTRRLASCGSSTVQT